MLVEKEPYKSEQEYAFVRHMEVQKIMKSLSKVENKYVKDFGQCCYSN